MSLKALAWNSRSVKPKFAELSHFVDANKIEVLFLSETWLEQSQIFHFPSFDCYRVDRKYGGVAILIRKTIIKKEAYVAVKFPCHLLKQFQLK